MILRIAEFLFLKLIILLGVLGIHLDFQAVIRTCAVCEDTWTRLLCLISRRFHVLISSASGTEQGDLCISQPRSALDPLHRHFFDLMAVISGQIEWLRRIYTQVADWTVYQSHGLHARGSQQEREQKFHVRMCCLQQDQCQVSCKEALQDHRALSGLNA